MRAEMLYHSFPRRSSEEADAKSINIFRNILQVGLLITPEITQWKTSKGEPFKVAQKRICFTALSSSELEAHSKIFGDISIGFSRKELEKVGATPVFYVPRTVESQTQENNIGGFYVERLYQIMALVQSLRKDKEIFSFNKREVNLLDLEMFLRMLSGLFYPVEDVEQGKDRYYFAQNEWRIMGNLLQGTRPLSRKLNQDEMKHITEIDPTFFKKTMEFPTGVYKIIEQSMVLTNIGDQPVKDMITEVVVPKRLQSQVLDLMREFQINPSFVVF
jgi:hypothetical protein